MQDVSCFLSFLVTSGILVNSQSCHSSCSFCTGLSAGFACIRDSLNRAFRQMDVGPIIDIFWETFGVTKYLSAADQRLIERL